MELRNFGLMGRRGGLLGAVLLAWVRGGRVGLGRGLALFFFSRVRSMCCRSPPRLRLFDRYPIRLTRGSVFLVLFLEFCSAPVGTTLRVEQHPRLEQVFMQSCAVRLDH